MATKIEMIQLTLSFKDSIEVSSFTETFQHFSAAVCNNLHQEVVGFYDIKVIKKQKMRADIKIRKQNLI